VKAFDNLYQRPFTFEKTGNGEVYDSDSRKISTMIYEEKDLQGGSGDELTHTFPGTLSVGPAFNLDLVIAKQGCLGCVDALTTKVTVNQEAYKNAVPKADAFRSEIEQFSGFMINHQKKISVFIQLKNEQCLPFPSLDPIGK
jgi:hypothetical protein